MKIQIVSEEILLNYQKKYQVLLVDLRDYESYSQNHLPDALWISHKNTLEKLPLLIEHYYCMHGREPDWIALYCYSGKISLVTAKELARHGYSVLSLYGGFHEWQRKHA